MKTLAFALAILGVWAFAAAATEPQASHHFLAGNDLYQWCQNPDDRRICAAYAEGVVDALVSDEAARSAAQHRNLRTVCLPADVSGGQLIDIVVQYLAQHPQTRHLSAAVEVKAAVAAAFPCP